MTSRPRAHSRVERWWPHACACLCLPPPPPRQPQKPGPDSEDPATDSVRDVSISTLYLVSTTVDRMSHVSVQTPLCE